MSMESASNNVLNIERLQVAVLVGENEDILKSVSLTVRRGERVGLVGESGSGKSMLSLSVMGLLPSGIGYAGGSITVSGTEVVGASARTLTSMRGSVMSMIYQDPMSSLNPVHTVGRQISEAIRTHEKVTKKGARARAVDLLRRVGIRSPEQAVNRYPHEFSGGMRQRVMIAMAVACQPRLLLADEPTTALDVTTQATIIEILTELVESTDMSVLFVTHDLAVAGAFCDRIAVMKAGRIVEDGDAAQIIGKPSDSYTRSLVESIVTLRTDPSLPLVTLSEDRIRE